MPAKEALRLAEERRREIVSILKSEGQVSVDALARRFKVSTVTLRTDLAQLAKKGMLVRSYGGATLPAGPRDEFPLDIKSAIHHAEKVRIGQRAAQLVQSHQTVILDSGTTSAEVAKAIKASRPAGLNVITHALNIAQEFSDAPNVSVIVIGGLMRHVSGSLVGPQAEHMMRELHADHFFLGIDGLSAENELSTPDLLEAQLNKLMTQMAQEITVVADASKIGRRSLSVIGNVSAVDRLITDSRIPTEAVERIRQSGVEVLVV
ncbi:MAG TPA: DeoR/GlpR family DNA-binding transcription regulator [Bryobacteraceae bacterium]